MSYIKTLLLSPIEDNPEPEEDGSSWASMYRLTYGAQAGSWVNILEGEAVLFSNGDCVLRSDLDAFLQDFPEMKDVPDAQTYFGNILKELQGQGVPHA